MLTVANVVYLEIWPLHHSNLILLLLHTASCPTGAVSEAERHGFLDFLVFVLLPKCLDYVVRWILFVCVDKVKHNPESERLFYFEN